jgi:Tfp pilus assembly protein PilV
MKRQPMNKGFTLIETTVAMLVMMIVGLGASSLFLYAARYNSGGTQRSTAMAIAQQRVEALRGTDFTDARLAFNLNTTENVVVTGTDVTYAAAGAAAPAGASESMRYQLLTQVVPFPIGTAAASATQKQITLRVTPVNGKGAAAWENLNPVEVVFRRSSVTPGPYKQ